MNINCPHCNQGINCSEELAGTKQECPNCGSEFEIPAFANSVISREENTRSLYTGCLIEQRRKAFAFLFPVNSKKFEIPFLTWIFLVMGVLSLIVAVVLLFVFFSTTVEANPLQEPYNAISRDDDSKLYGWFFLLFLVNGIVCLGAAQVVFFVGRICFNLDRIVNKIVSNDGA